jgi:phenylpropionate dioxygenase-like ring-hydroxylating dioxygenase large terminal subunit
MTYLLNCWYLVAWEEDLPPGSHVLRTIAERPLIISRREAGEVDVLLDRCPHRFVPLSRGRIEEDSITCGYHGIVFNRQGKCIHNPHGPLVAALQVPSYPAVSKHSGIWVWLGDAEQADPALVPDLSVMNDYPAVAQNFGYEFISANYLLCTDNILDLSHADYVHRDSLGGGATTRAKQKVQESEGEITINWFAENDVVPPALDAMMDEKGQPGDLHLSVRWNAPGAMLLNFGAVPTGKPERGGPDTWGIHVMTPQDANHTHYFFWNARNRIWEPEFNKFVRETMKQAFAREDKPMLEAQQASIGTADFETLSPVLLRTDEGPVRMRRKMRALIEGEQAVMAAK